MVLPSLDKHTNTLCLSEALIGDKESHGASALSGADGERPKQGPNRPWSEMPRDDVDLFLRQDIE